MRRTLFALVTTWPVFSLGFVLVLAVSSSGTGTGQVQVSGDRSGGAVMVSTPGADDVAAEHTDDHVRMTSQMRVVDPNPRMQNRMATDAMWEMMHDPVHIRAEEDYHRQLDRMLARTTPASAG